MISAEHYFDWAATAPSDAEIQTKALQETFEHWANPSSIHEAGKDARKFLEESRQIASDALNVKAENLFFTSGGTESDHIPLLALLNRPQKGSVIISSIEHPALHEMGKSLENSGWKVLSVRPDKNGFIHAEDVLKLLQDDTAFISIMAVNNETGAIQDINSIANEVAKASEGKRRPFFHTDCVQAAGKIPLNLSNKNIDSAAFSAHKIGGPRGTGLLYLNKEINPFLRGGGQEKGIRSGTENVFGARALALCLQKYLISEKNPVAMTRFKEQQEYTADFINQILKIKNCKIIPSCRTSGVQDGTKNFSPWIVQASFEGIPGQVLERALSAKGFYISTGSACSSKTKSHPALDSMNIPPSQKESAVRFSFGFSTTKSAMDSLVSATSEICSVFFS